MHECIGCLERQIVHKMWSCRSFEGGKRFVRDFIVTWERNINQWKRFRKGVLFGEKFFRQSQVEFFLGNEERNKEIVLLIYTYRFWNFSIYSSLKYEACFLKISNGIFCEDEFRVYRGWIITIENKIGGIKRGFTTDSLCQLFN